MYTPSLITILYATVALGLTIPSSDLAARDVDDSIIQKGTLVVRAPKPANTNVNPAAITGTTCTAKGTAINSHDINVAILSICGGIAGTIQNCQGNPTSTVGASGTAKLSLEAETAGTTIDISKGRWEGCMRAARAVCGDSPFTSACIGGANGNTNNVVFSLTKQ